MARKKFDFQAIGMNVLGAGIGSVGAKFLNQPLQNVNPNLRAAIKIGVGAGLPLIAPKFMILQGIGNGILAVGAGELVEQLAPGLVSGIGQEDLPLLEEGDEEGGFVTDVDFEEILSGEGDDPTDVLGGEGDDPTDVLGRGEEEEEEEEEEDD